MEHCVIYCRKSDVSALATDVSFDDQEQTCRDYAREHGYSVVRVYRESHSGADLAGRPLIWEAIDDIKQGRAQVLLVRNYDRLARNFTHQKAIEYEVRDKLGGRIESALEPVDPNDPMQRVTRDILGAVAEMERVNSVARMERGKVRRAERGQLPGASNPLFGYRWEDDEPGKRTVYVVDPETGAVVKRIFSLAVAGHSLRAIARILGNAPTPSQWNQQNGHLGRHHVATLGWQAAQVRRILGDRTYTGEAVAYRYHKVKSANGTHYSALRPEDDAKRITITVPALVDVATFEAANNAIQARETNGRPPQDPEATWLRRHVFCGICEGRMVVERVGDAYVYRCRNRGGTCKDFNIRAHLLDDDVYQGLADFLSKREEVRDLMTKQLRTDKVQALVSVAEGFQVQIVEKQQLADTARRRSFQTTDDDLALKYLHDAETLNAEVRGLEKEYATARDELDTFNAGNAQIDAILDLIYSGQDVPIAVGVWMLKYEQKRLLLARTGLRAEVFPVGYREDGRRVVVRFAWDIPGELLQPGGRMLQLVIELP